MIPDTDKAYIAGLFDGEGSIHMRRGIEKKKKHKGKPGYRLSNSLRLSMEITMTDRSVLMWIHEVQTRNKAIKYRRDLVARTMELVDKLDETGITDLMIQIEAEYERKYGKNEADDKVILQDNEVSARCRTGVDSVDNLVLFQNNSKFSASKVYKFY